MEGRRIFHVDWILLVLIILACLLGMFFVYSASGMNEDILIKQGIRILAGLFAMLFVAQVSPGALQRLAPKLYLIALSLLIAVLLFGVVGKGAQRWLDLGFMRLQPSEIMKLAMPLMIAWWVNLYPLPAGFKQVIIASTLVFFPALLIAFQPDLGTSLLIAGSGIVVIFLAGISWSFIAFVTGSVLVAVPAMYYLVLHDYQKRRILTLFNPWQDPLGDGYHTIQSMIAIGSGGVFGKGWLQGTQSQLDFLPERHTDFIFSVFSEELGFSGFCLLMLLYLAIVYRGLRIAFNTRDTFARLVAGSLTITFFFYVFVNIGMVAGILPVVGVPLPLISYGGTSMVTLMTGFGVLMAIHSHRNVVGH